MILGPCSRCGEDLANRPHWTNLHLHHDCYEANTRDVKTAQEKIKQANQRREEPKL